MTILIFLLYEIRYPIYPRSRVNHIETNNVMKIHVTETKEVKKTYLAFNSKFLIKENTRQLLLLESLLLHLYQYRWHLNCVLSALCRLYPSAHLPQLHVPNNSLIWQGTVSMFPRALKNNYCRSSSVVLLYRKLLFSRYTNSEWLIRIFQSGTFCQWWNFR